MQPVYLVYKITNKINGKFYIGVHGTTRIDDGYMGSGSLIKAAIKKYGKDNFEKQILHVCKDEFEAYSLEEQLVTESLAEDDKCYNMSPGGRGGRYGKYNYWHGKPLPDHMKTYLATLASKQWKGVSKTKEHREKIGMANKSNRRDDLALYNVTKKSYPIIFEDTIYRSIREAMRCTKRSQKWIQDRAVRL